MIRSKQPRFPLAGCLHLSWAFCAVTVGLFAGCAHGPKGDEHAKDRVQVNEALDDLRLAQVELVGSEGGPARGVMTFEQMPNSVIVTFHVEGLQPRATYSVALRDGQSCGSATSTGAATLSKLRTDRKGVAEGSFRTETVSLGGRRSVLGDAVVISAVLQKNGTSAKLPKQPQGARIVCGEVRAKSPNVSQE